MTVDCLRGRYTIDAVKIVHDLGRPLSRQIDRGQIEGALAQGIGWMTLEDLVFDERAGCSRRRSPSYKVPDADFLPKELDRRAGRGHPERGRPYGTKAVGEPPLMYGIGVYFALRHALRAFRPAAELPFVTPMTPERVLMSTHEGIAPGEAGARRVEQPELARLGGGKRLRQAFFWRGILAELEAGHPVFLAWVVGATEPLAGHPRRPDVAVASGARQGTIGGGIMEKKLEEKGPRPCWRDPPPDFFEVRELHHSREAEGERSGMICAGSQRNLALLLRPERDYAAVAAVVDALAADLAGLPGAQLARCGASA